MKIVRFAFLLAVLLPSSFLAAPEEPAAMLPAAFQADVPNLAGTWLGDQGAWVVEQDGARIRTVSLGQSSLPYSPEGTLTLMPLGMKFTYARGAAWLTLGTDRDHLRVQQAINQGEIELERIGSEARFGVPALLAAFRRRPDQRAAILWALGSLEKKAREAIPVLVEGIGNAKPREARVIEHLLGAIGPADPSMLASLRRSTQSVNPDVRAAAIDVLAGMEPRPAQVVPQLIQMLGDPDPGPRFAATAGLTRIGAPAFPELLDCVAAEDPRISVGALGALQRMGPSGLNVVHCVAQTAKLDSLREEARRILDPGLADDDRPKQGGGFWPQWRGPERDNISTDTGLLDEWPEGGPPLAWEVRGIGLGIAPPAVRGGRVYVVGYLGAWECVTALDEKSGRRLWSTVIGRAMSEAGDMRWLQQRTPAVDRDLLFIFRYDGTLVCLRVEDGREQWRKDYKADFESSGVGWGQSDYPLVDGERLLCVPGGPKTSLAALDKRTGRLLWSRQVPGASMSCSPMVMATIRGRRQGVAVLSHAIVGFDPRDGTILWMSTGDSDFSWAHMFPRSTSIIRGDRLWINPDYMASFVPLQFGENGKLFTPDRNRFRKIHPGWLQDSSLAFGDFLYLPGSLTSSNDLICVNLDTGGIAWDVRAGGQGTPSFTLAEGKLYVFSPYGRVALVDATPEAYRPGSHFNLPRQKDLTCVPNPVVTGGRLYLRHDEDTLLCYDVRKRAADPGIPRSTPLILESPVRPLTPADPLPPAVYVPTPKDVVRRMLELAGVERDHKVIDLGSGDGRILIEAAKRYGARALGLELDPDLVRVSREAAQSANLNNYSVRVERQDLFTADLSEVDVVAVYLPPSFLERLLPRFRKLKKGARIVSHEFVIPGIPPEETVRMISEADGREHAIHLWRAPLK